MGKRLTIFELHTHGDVQFGPASLESALETAATDNTTDTTASSDDDDGGSGNKGIALLIGLAALVALAAVIKYTRGGDEQEPVELAESDDL